MKKSTYIAAVILGFISMTSCQKNEFYEIVSSSTSEESTQFSADGEFIDSGRFSTNKVEDISTASDESALFPWDKEIIEINIKEVSDGDDEADDGDDSKTD